MTATPRLWPVTCFTRGTMTHLTRDGRKTLCGARVELTNRTGRNPTTEVVDIGSACQRPGCRHAWPEWERTGGTIDRD